MTGRENEVRSCGQYSGGIERMTREIEDIRERSRGSMRFGHPVAKNFGASYALVSLAESSQLRRDLLESYGRRGDWILAAAVSTVIASYGLDNHSANVESNMSRELLGIADTCDPWEIASYLPTVGGAEDQSLAKFQKLRASRAGCVLISDDSIIGSDGSHEPADGDECMVVLTDLEGIPIGYINRPYGQLRGMDPVNLHERLRAMGIGRSVFSLGRKGYDATVYKGIIDERSGFVSRSDDRDCARDAVRMMESSGTIHRHRGREYVVGSGNVRITGDGCGKLTIVPESDPRYNEESASGRFRVWAFREHGAAGIDRARVERRISVIERRIRSLPPEVAMEQFPETAGSLSRFFHISLRDGQLDFSVREDELAAYLESGPSIVLSNGYGSWERVMGAIDLQARVDDTMDSLEEILGINGPGGSPRHSSGDDLVSFVSLVLWRIMAKRMAASGLDPDVPAMLEKLNTIKTVGDGLNWKIVGLNPGNRSMLRALGIETPRGDIRTLPYVYDREASRRII